MDIQKKYDSLCLPSKIYTTLAFIGLLFSLLIMFKLGSFTLMSLFGIVLRIVFYLFWTWVLDSLCNNGYSMVSWLLLGMPYFFLIIAILLTPIKVLKKILKV